MLFFMGNVIFLLLQVTIPNVMENIQFHLPVLLPLKGEPTKPTDTQAGHQYQVLQSCGPTTPGTL